MRPDAKEIDVETNTRIEKGKTVVSVQFMVNGTFTEDEIDRLKDVIAIELWPSTAQRVVLPQ